VIEREEKKGKCFLGKGREKKGREKEAKSSPKMRPSHALHNVVFKEGKKGEEVRASKTNRRRSDLRCAARGGDR